MDALVSTGWLADHLDDDDLRVLDCTVILEPAEGGGFRAVQSWHRDIHNYHGGAAVAGCLIHHQTIAGFADHDHVRLGIHQRFQTLAHDLVVVGQKDTQLIHRLGPLILGAAGRAQ